MPKKGLIALLTIDAACIAVGFHVGGWLGAYLVIVPGAWAVNTLWDYHREVSPCPKK